MTPTIVSEYQREGSMKKKQNIAESEFLNSEGSSFAGTEQIKKKAKSSIIEQLSRKKKEMAEREVSRTDQAKSKKQDMEL